MLLDTISLDKQDKVNPELERAGKESKAVRIRTADGQIFIAFPEDGFDRMCEVVQSPEFAAALKEGVEQFHRGEATLIRDGKPAHD